MRNFTKFLSRSLAVLLAGMSFGCATFKENSLTCNLWQADPTGSNHDSKPDHKYIHGSFTRATLTSLAVVGDVTVVGLVIGAGLAVGSFAEACQEGARNGGRTSY
jgi:hypothetical protein